tara:strand:+ start:5925 stop:7595 length:1671 start_codon:yes stop_codon:yes gene_type:complete
MKNLVSFVQSKEEINFIVNKINQDVLFIPLNLDSLIYLKRQKKFYLNPKYYFSNEKHKKALTFTEKFISKLNYGDLKFEGLKLEFRSQIRFIINSCIFVIELYKKVLEEKNISLVLSGWHGQNLKKYKSNEIFLSSFIIENCLNLKEKINISSDYEEFNQNRFKNFYNYFINPNQIKGSSILINNLGYNFFRILIYKKLFQNVYYFNFGEKKLNFIKKIIFLLLGCKEIISEKKKIEFKEIIKIPDTHLTYENFDLTKIINSKKKELIIELSDSMNKLNAIKNFLKKKQFKRYFSFHSRGVDGSISELLNKCTSINISHGTVAESYTKYDALYKKIIADSVFSGKFKYFTIQSELCRKSLLNTNSKIKNTIKTGNLIFSNIKKDISDKEYLLYAVTLKKFHGLQFFGVEMFYEFFENLKLLNNIANKDKKIIVNIHASHKNILEEIKPFFSNLYFTCEKIDKVLDKSYALISFSSTAIEDALANNRYVILLDQWKRYQHYKPSTEREKKNIYYVNSEDELNKLIDNLNKKKTIKVNFLKNNLKNNFNLILKSDHES